ncbi:unnamed protein product [Prunus armeniaca]
MSCIEKLQCQCVWHAKLVRSNTSKGAYGEDILEEALVFTTAHLESKITHVRYSLATQISQALDRPLLKCLERWWKEVDFERKLPFGRDCGIVLLDNGRKILNKVIALGTVMDDIYDAFGTFKELEIITEAIRRTPTIDTLKMIMVDAIFSICQMQWKDTAKLTLIRPDGYTKDMRPRHGGFEKESGYVASCIDCYMKQHGVSEQETLDDVFNKQVVEGYKRGAPYKTN